MACQDAMVWTQKRRMIAVVFAVMCLSGVGVLAFPHAGNHHAEQWHGDGTTLNLPEIILGRCYEYITMKNPGVGNKDCIQLLNMLAASVMNKNQCDIRPEDYEELMAVTSYPILCDRSVFWSNTNELVHRYANAAQNLVTMEDTLLGYIVNGLLWCGKSYASEFNYQSCPSRYDCENNPISVFWKLASEHFAKQACGVIHVMLNGSSTTGAIQPNSIFRTIEVPNLDPLRVKEVKIWVMDNIEGPDRDSCGSPRLLELESTLKKWNIHSSCVDNYWPAQILQCVSNPGKCLQV
ncbi:ADP-ribosyl cyclase/cyclic ADP-ribose hydrolase 1-like [Lissotriton helveticus]